jgi:hypothetical protein
MNTFEPLPYDGKVWDNYRVGGNMTIDEAKQCMVEEFSAAIAIRWDDVKDSEFARILNLSEPTYTGPDRAGAAAVEALLADRKVTP